MLFPSCVEEGYVCGRWRWKKGSPQSYLLGTGVEWMLQVWATKNRTKQASHPDGAWFLLILSSWWAREEMSLWQWLSKPHGRTWEVMYLSIEPGGHQTKQLLSAWGPCYLSRALGEQKTWARMNWKHRLCHKQKEKCAWQQTGAVFIYPALLTAPVGGWEDGAPGSGVSQGRQNSAADVVMRVQEPGKGDRGSWCLRKYLRVKTVLT